MTGRLGPAACLIAALTALTPAPPPATAGEPAWERAALERAPDGIRAPDFALRDLSGRTVGLAALRGRYVVLNFWASWCAPCEMEMPAMQRLQEAFPPSELVVVAVNFREDREHVDGFLRRRGVVLSVLLDPDGGVFRRYRVVTLPFTVLIDPRGEVLAVAEGPRNWDDPEVVALLRALPRRGR